MMTVRQLKRIVVALGAIGALLSAQEVRAEAPESWLGQRVMTRPGTPLKVRRETVDRGVDPHVYTVTAIQGPWVWLTSETTSRSGWTKTSTLLTCEQALNYCSARINHNNRDADAYLWRAAARMDLQQYDPALGDMNRAAALAPARDLRLMRGSFWFMQQEYDKALAETNEWIRLHPTDGLGYSNRGEIWLHKREYDRGIADFDKAIKLGADVAAAYSGRGRCWAEKQDFEMAISDFDQALKLNPRSGETLHDRAMTWGEMQQFAKGVLDLSKAIELTTSKMVTAMLLAHRAAARKAMNQPLKALADCNAALRLDPKCLDALVGRGDVRASCNELDEAMLDFNEALALHPGFVPALVARARVSMQLFKFAAAIKDLQEALPLAPEDPECYEKLAIIWATCPAEEYRNPKKAIEAATKACELTGWKDAFNFSLLAQAYAAAGNLEKAVEIQEKAVSSAEDEKTREEYRLDLWLYRQQNPAPIKL